MFTLAISCLTTFNLSWFMDLTSQFLCNMAFYSNWTLLPSPVTSTTGHCFHFGSMFSFFLELFLHFSPVAYWTPTDLGSSCFSVLSFCLFILFMEFSRQEYWILPFPSPGDHILSELFTILTKRLESIKLLITQGEKLSRFRPGDTQTCLNAPGERLCSLHGVITMPTLSSEELQNGDLSAQCPSRIRIRTKGREGILTPAQSSLMIPGKRKLESRW